MVKKIALWAVYVLIVGLLVFGAANRTSAKTDQGILFGNMDEIVSGRGQATGVTGNYDENGNFESSDHEEILEEQDWVSYSGQITSIGAEALEIQTGVAGILEIEGRPWRFAQELGYDPLEGNEVMVQDFMKMESSRYLSLTTFLLTKFLNCGTSTGNPCGAEAVEIN